MPTGRFVRSVLRATVLAFVAFAALAGAQAKAPMTTLRMSVSRATHVFVARIVRAEIGTWSETPDPNFRSRQATVTICPVRLLKGSAPSADSPEPTSITVMQTEDSSARPRHRFLRAWDGVDLRAGAEVILLVNVPGASRWRQLTHEIGTICVLPADRERELATIAREQSP